MLPPAVARRLPRLASAALLAMLAMPLGAQVHGHAELGGAVVRQPDIGASDAITAQGGLAWERRWFVVQTGLSLTDPMSGPMRGYGTIGGTLRAPLGRSLLAELTAQGTRYDDGAFDPLLSNQFAARVVGTLPRARAWAGAGAGSLDDGIWVYPVRTIEGGALAALRGAIVTATATWSATESEPRQVIVDEPTPITISVRDRIAYTDATIGAQVEQGRLELRVRGGLRFIHETVLDGPRASRPFGDADGAWWVTPRVAIAASAGRDLADLARGFPDAHYVTLSVRARLRPPARRIVTPAGVGTAPRGPGAPAAARPAMPTAPHVLVERGDAPGALLRVLAPASVTRVEVSGTFSDWEPLALAKDEQGEWVLAARLPSGTHRLVLRVDGGDWMAPPNLPALEDELSGRVAVVTVP